MEPQRARIDASGRLVVPVAVRRELDLRDGDELTFTAGDSPGEMRVASRRAGLKRAQALVAEFSTRGGSAVDDLLRERREDARREQVRHRVSTAARRQRGRSRPSG
jgi:bifunctional DNA-binding transcriptional regulator/antitoxin component of YhaV-PrlF toxin-antitoxin module